jgi:hypothetical protein
MCIYVYGVYGVEHIYIKATTTRTVKVSFI